MKNILKDCFFILLCFGLLVVVLFIYKRGFVEGFDLIGQDSTKPIPEQYKYLAPLPEGVVWNPEIQDKYVAKMKAIDPNFTKEVLSTPNPFLGNKTFMEISSSIEAQYFLDNGLWPWDDYIINYIKSKGATDADIEKSRKQLPNRAFYLIFVESQTVPQIKMLDDIFNPTAHKTDNGKYWKCQSGVLQTSDAEAGPFTDSTDYSFFSTNIPGFSFEGDACNVCAIPQVQQQLGAGAHTIQETYDSSINTCKFKLSQEVPEAYNIYIGKYGNAPSESVPSDTSDHAKCVKKCDDQLSK